MTNKILAVFANPKGTNQLRLGEEDRAIRECIKRSKYRENIPLTTCHATTIDDLCRQLLEEDFRILHISGHGTGRGLVFETQDGKIKIPPQKVLADTFRAYAPPLECVILNSCYSRTQGVLIALGVPYTIAMENAIADRAAIEFARGFYDAIGAGKNIEFAYEEGCRRIHLNHSPTQQLPILLRKDEVIKWPPSELPIILDTGYAAYLDDISAEGLCQCEREKCADSYEKRYCYWGKWLAEWIIKKRLYYKCYDEIIVCPRCGQEHKRGNIGKENICKRPYKDQIQQTD